MTIEQQALNVQKACNGDEYHKCINFKLSIVSDYPLEYPFTVGSFMREFITVEEAQNINDEISDRMLTQENDTL